MSKCNTLRNYSRALRRSRIASLYGRMSYGKIARIIGCSRSCVAGVIRWHVKQASRDATRMPRDATSVARYMEENSAAWRGYEARPPSVAYVKGLEAYGNSRYIMRSMEHADI